MCPSLTLQQIYKLTEHHHDDWITGSQSTDTIVLLKTLKRVVDAAVRPCLGACSLFTWEQHVPRSILPLAAVQQSTAPFHVCNQCNGCSAWSKVPLLVCLFDESTPASYGLMELGSGEGGMSGKVGWTPQVCCVSAVLCTVFF